MPVEERSASTMTSQIALVLPISARDRDLVSWRLGGASAVAHCVQAARSSRVPIGGVVVAVARGLVVDVEAGLAAQSLLSSATLVPVGGEASRAECLRAAVFSLESTSPETKNVLVHDLGRPLASAELCARVAEALEGGRHAVIPALALVDSVKAVDSTGAVRATVDRTALRSAQFPRGFALSLLREGLEVSFGDEFDEVRYAIANGVAVDLVAGDPDAFLVDRSRDAALVEAILACRIAGHR